MYKIIRVFITVILFAMFSASCISYSDFNKLYIVDADDLSQDTVDKIIEAVNDKDATGLKTMFSKNTCDNAPEIEEDIARLFEFVQGEITDYGITSGPHTSKKSEGSKIESDIDICFYIQTTENKYHIALHERIIDTVDKNNVGILCFEIIRDVDWTEDHVYGGSDNGEKQGIIIDNED